MGPSRIQNWSVGFLLLLVVSIPWIRFGLDTPTILVQELDHCPELACDFARHYLAQAQFWMEGTSNMDPGWFYPPLLMLLISPMTQVNDPVMWWTVFNLFGVGCIAWFIGRQIDSSWRTVVALLLCLSSLPILHAVKWGQISIWLTVAILVFLTSQSRTTKSLFLGFAVAIKIYPLVLLLIELFSKRLSVVVWTIFIAILAGGLLPWMMLGDAFELYWQAVARGQQMVRDMAPMSGGQALAPTFHRWFVTGEHIGGQWNLEPLVIGIPWLKQIFLLVWVAIGLYDAYRLRTQEVSSLHAIYWIIWIHLLLQPGWVHYFCWLPFAQVVVWNSASVRDRWWLIGFGLVERLPIVFLSSFAYFSFVRIGGLTVTVLAVWSIARIEMMKTLK